MIRRIILILCLVLGAAVSAVSQTTSRFYPAERLSNSMISCIVQDRYGYIWVGTEHGLNRFDGYTFTVYLDSEADTTALPNNNITLLRTDRQGRLWIGTGEGLCHYDYSAGVFRHHNVSDGTKPRINSMAELPDGRLVFGTAGYGLYALQSDGTLRADHSFDSRKYDNAYYSRMLADSHGRLWRAGTTNIITMRDVARRAKQTVDLPADVGPIYALIESRGRVLVVGLFGIDEYKGGRFQKSGIDLGAIGGDRPMLSTATIDKAGNILLGTRNHGLFTVPAGGTKAVQTLPAAGDFDLSTTNIDAIHCDRDGNIWIGSKRHGLAMSNPTRPPFGSLRFSQKHIDIGTYISSVAVGEGDKLYVVIHNRGVCTVSPGGNVSPLRNNPPAVQTITRDKTGRYFLGTGNSLYQYDPESGAAKRLVQIECDRINAIVSDGQGHVYFSAFAKGFCSYDIAKGELRNYSFEGGTDKKDALCNNWIMGLALDSRGLLWLATSSGTACFDPRRRTFLTYGRKAILEGTMCLSVAEDADGAMLIGTDHGLWRYDTKKREAQRPKGAEPLRDKMINAIVRDRRGGIWYATSDGIWQWQNRHKRLAGYVHGGGLISKEYILGACAIGPDGRIYFGTNDGVTAFMPDDIRQLHAKTVPLQLTAFMIGGHPASAATVSGNSKVMDGYVGEQTHFTVAYADNSFLLNFSQLQYDNPENIVLEYRVNGTEWQRNNEGDTQIAFNHLQSGTYTLEVRALEGTAYSDIKRYSITVLAPWYATALAYSIYVILLVAFIVYMVYAYDRDRRKQFEEYKMKFLINATHDIRSPLTLIKSPLSNLRKRIALLSEGEQKTGMTDDIETIERNAGRVLSLVNQILDLRKMDKEQMHLHCRQTNLVETAAVACKMYEYNARQRGMTLRFEPEDERIDVWIDRTQFDKVLSNLLSNAFKYTPDGGTITVALRQTADTATLTVADTGVGLGAGDSKHIFDRFYQARNARQIKTEGTGIGLNLCKMIMDLHHGDITAQNRTDAQGSIFTVTIPLGKAHLLPDEIDKTVEPEVRQHKTAAKSGRRVLIVDDDTEIADYICRELGEQYKFTTAPNGKEGLREALTAQTPYDAIVSDVMMPELDGFSMLRMIKTNPNVAHIPVIMLTSKADVGNRLEGLDRGADAFLAKPFDMDELHATIDNVIEKTIRLRGKFSGAQQQTERVEQQEVKGNDEQLMERIMKSVNKHLGDSDFSVDMLTDEVGISRAQLHRKMKEMTGLSTSEFIRNIRLEQAARLLKEQKVNITQVAYTVGFSNLAHFSTVFRKHFGMTPTEYSARNAEESEE